MTDLSSVQHLARPRPEKAPTGTPSSSGSMNTATVTAGESALGFFANQAESPTRHSPGRGW